MPCPRSPRRTVGLFRRTLGLLGGWLDAPRRDDLRPAARLRLEVAEGREHCSESVGVILGLSVLGDAAQARSAPTAVRADVSAPKDDASVRGGERPAPVDPGADAPARHDRTAATFTADSTAFVRPAVAPRADFGDDTATATPTRVAPPARDERPTTGGDAVPATRADAPAGGGHDGAAVAAPDAVTPVLPSTPAAPAAPVAAPTAVAPAATGVASSGGATAPPAAALATASPTLLPATPAPVTIRPTPGMSTAPAPTLDALLAGLSLPPADKAAAPAPTTAARGSAGGSPAYVTSLPANCACASQMYDVVQYAAGAYGNVPWYGSETGVRYADGNVTLAVADLTSNGFGLPWGQSRAWTNHVIDDDGTFGNGWVNSTLPALVTDGTTVVLVSNGVNAHYFDPDGSGGYRSRFFDQSRLTLEAKTTLGDTVFVLTDTAGNRAFFQDVAATGAWAGRLLQYVDPMGNGVRVTAWAGGKAATVDRVEGGAVAGNERFTYAYVGGSGPNAGRLESVVQSRLDTTLATPALVAVRAVTYEYYGSSDS